MTDVKRSAWALYEHLRVGHQMTAAELAGLTSLDQLRAFHAGLACRDGSTW